jgi:hypothetical protein
MLNMSKTDRYRLLKVVYTSFTSEYIYALYVKNSLIFDGKINLRVWCMAGAQYKQMV